MARKYSIWNAAVAALQFWTADLNAYTLGCATEQVLSAFFYSSSTHYSISNLMKYYLVAS